MCSLEGLVNVSYSSRTHSLLVTMNIELLAQTLHSCPDKACQATPLSDTFLTVLVMSTRFTNTESHLDWSMKE